MNRNAVTWLLMLVLCLICASSGLSHLLASNENAFAATSTSSATNFMPENDYSCIGEVIVQLGPDCEAEITIPMVLKGSGVDTLTGFNVLVSYPNGSGTVNYVRGHGRFTYEVFDEQDELVCWGNLTAEDKTPPQIVPPLKADTLTCTDIDSILNRDLDDFNGRIWQRLRDRNIFNIDTALTDNCSDRSNIKLLVTDHFFPSEGECEVSGRIERHLQATDEKGNVSAVTRIEFVFLQPELFYDDLKDTLISFCAEGEDYQLTPEEAGAPYYFNAFGNKQYVYAADTVFCNYAISFRDDSSAVACGYKLIRTWVITNWCTPEDPRDTIQQEIKYGDFDAPQVFCRPVNYSYSTGPFDCTASIEVPRPVVNDCNPDWTYTVEVYTKEAELDIFGIPTGDSVFVKRNEPILGDPEAGYLATGIPIGRHYFYYYVSDVCGNTAEVLKCEFEVVDRTPPAPVCFDLVNISLGGKGIGSVEYSDVDEGSTDNCEIASRQLRREIQEDCLDAYVDAVLSGGEGFYTFDDLVKDAGANIWRFEDQIVVTRKGSIYYSAFMDEVVVNCCDIGTIVTIEMKVTDKSGNENSCWSLLQIEDKVPPVCYAPDDVTVDCDTALINRNEYGDTTILQQYYGKAEATDNCGATVKELAPVVEVNECGFGTITRRFQAKDASGNTSGICTQTITIVGIFDYELRLPKDESSIICGRVEPDTLLYQLLACENLVVNVEDETFDAADDACFKIFRTYTIINWCEYDGQSDPLVIGRDENQNGIVGEEVYLLRRRDGAFYIDENNDETDGFLRTGIAGGYYQYSQIIKVYDQESPVLRFETLSAFCSYDTPSGPDDVCEGQVMVPFSVDDNCTPEELETRVFLDENADGAFMVEITNSPMLVKEGRQFMFTADLPIGNHRLQVRVVDPCGNFIVRSIPFEVEDCKAPSPICIQGVTVELMPVDQDGNGVPDFGMNLVPARSLIGSEVFDCSGKVTYSIHRKGEAPDVNQTSLMVSCLDPFNETLPVEVYAWDEKGNKNACETFIVVQDNGRFCGGGIENGRIAGAIYTEEDIPMENVAVRLSGNRSGNVRTDFDGVFEFVDLEEGQDYSVEPFKNDDYRNGVSTYDLVLVSKHILGVQKLETPYQVIAADVNRSNSVTSLDLIHLRKLILSINDTFPNNNSWRFVRRDHVFEAPERPWAGGIPEVVNVNNLIGTFDEANFVAVKIGDVNGSARLSQTLIAEEPRSMTGPMEMLVTEQLLAAGEPAEIVLTLGDLAKTMGCQFTFSFDPGLLELKDIRYGLFREENVGLTQIADGLITVSWNQMQPGDFDPDASLIKLTFNSLKETRISEAIELNSRVTAAEAFDFQGHQKGIRLVFQDTHNPEAAFELLQNHPNPFQEHTVVRFHLPESSPATLTIHDLNGRMLRQIEDTFDAGLNELRINKKDLPAGLLLYTLQAGEWKEVKKMLVME